MIDAIKVGIFLGLFVYDFGSIVPWIISTNKIPIYIQIGLIILHLLIYSFLGKLIYIKFKKLYSKFKKLIY